MNANKKSIERLHQFLISTLRKPSKGQVAFWLVLSLIFAAIYAGEGLQKAFASAYVVQDDARQYVFWMQRFIDPDLLPNDLIADYYKSVTPLGYAWLYHLIASVGITPLLLSKLLPMVLGIITTVYAFGVSMQILPLPITGFLSTLLLNQSLLLKDDLVSATPRSFLYTLFTAFLYYLLQRSWLPCLVSIALQGLFYPLVTLVSLCLLFIRLWKWENGLLRLSKDREYYIFCMIAFGVAFLSVLPSALLSAKYGPTIAGSLARTLPEFLPGGRSKFFHNNPFLFWINGKDSSLIPWLKVQAILVGFSLPFLMRYPARFPLIKEFKNKANILLQIVLASLVMFLASHALLFKLYCPSRYTEHTLRIVLAIAGGLAFTLMLDAVLRSVGKIQSNKSFWKLALTGAIAIALLIYPHLLKEFPRTAYKIGIGPAIYEFFQSQPKDILIASLEGEANLIPTFSKRSILVGSEYALPYHTKYYDQIRQRAIDLINAQYSPNSAQIKSFIQKYDIDFWLISHSAFKPEYISKNRWIMQYQPEANNAINSIKQGKVPALSKIMPKCTVLDTQGLTILPAKCIIQFDSEPVN